MKNLSNYHQFSNRHIGPDDAEIKQMLQVTSAGSLNDFIRSVVPESIYMEKGLNIPDTVSEEAFLKEFKALSQQNKLFKSYIGFGYYNTYTPAVIQRNILENPGWYTAYTPYQAEIAQGRLEMLANFQTMVMNLTGMEIANASLLDEGTAAAEAMTMLYSVRKGEKKKAVKYLVDQHVFPQTLAVLETRAEPMGIQLEVCNLFEHNMNDPEVYGLFIQYPNSKGEIHDLANLIQVAKEHNVFVAVSTDLLALTLFTPPGEWGADVVVGSAQRLGVPPGYGGPHAAFFATREAYKRQVPGRMIGVSVDVHGNKAYRMALQTREQHIKREKATSNICTAQVLLAVMASAYGIYHGPEGLKQIATNIHRKTSWLADNLGRLGFSTNDSYFDTLFVPLSGDQKQQLKAIAEKNEINLNYFQHDAVQLSLDETVTNSDLETLFGLFMELTGITEPMTAEFPEVDLAEGLRRTSAFMEHPVFNTHHSEHEMLRYLKRMENKDLSLVHSMISLGSCTMKLNATTEMIPVTWPEFAMMHPFAPSSQTKGYEKMHEDLINWLCEITGFAGISLQPNSGAQGEYTGLLTIREYLMANGQQQRNIALIPTSAHGTNPASAVMAGMQVVLVATDDKGNIDLDDLRQKAADYKDILAALMVTYPSTHGVFEANIKEICSIIHENGGQVYMDGANMNAQVGLTSPALIGADVCHLNLHKTFCIPHGGGGPGMGPIGVAEHLKPFLPGHKLIETPHKGRHSVSAAPYGSAGILPISYAYIRMMGGSGLKKATEIAILNANYVKDILSKEYKILYTGKNNRSAHEFILDCRDFKQLGVEVEDIAKRLMDYGFHAPTVSFPVAGTLMIEPTESETLSELDRFCDAMLSIREEIREIEKGIYDQQNNVLKNAPHTMSIAMTTNWQYPYSREKAVMPISYLNDFKFWPSVSRIDSAYGDRNLFCACIPVEEYSEEQEPVS